MRFFALDLSLQIVSKLRPLIRVLRHHDRKLASQVSAAASSICLNLGEGNRRQGQDRNHLWRIASGSAEEVRVGLRLAQCWGYFDAVKTETVMDEIDHLQAMLWKLVH